MIYIIAQNDLDQFTQCMNLFNLFLQILISDGGMRSAGFRGCVPITSDKI